MFDKVRPSFNWVLYGDYEFINQSIMQNSIFAIIFTVQIIEHRVKTPVA